MLDILNSYSDQLKLNSYLLSLNDAMNINDNYYYQKSEKDGIYSITVKLPGYQREEIEVNLKTDEVYKKKYLTIKAENKEYGKYLDSFRVKNEIVEDSVKASLKNGILKISFSLEKVKTSKQFQIDIE